MLKILVGLKALWLNSLPVDPRQRQFAYLIGVLDLFALTLVLGGYTAAGLACFAAMTIVVVTAYRMKKKWRDQSHTK